jgi:Putative abortive phage resistance protein AbiGi, antitoxin
MGLGYRGNENWRDMSEYLVHFTKDDEVGHSAYDIMLMILGTGTLLPSGPFGAAKGLGVLGTSQRSVCFSEIPLDRLDRLTLRRSNYGIAFHQRKLVEAGGGRVWYVDSDSAIATNLRAMIDDRVKPGMDDSDRLWKLTPFIDLPGQYGSADYRFEWEREWRVPGPITFPPEDVAFLFIPESLHKKARIFFEDHRRENTGPGYLCPYLDPAWSDERIQNALSAV